MAKYSVLSAVNDPALVVTEAHLTRADAIVDSQLMALAINPADLTLPQAILTEQATCQALRIAAIEGAIGDNSPLIAKAREYEKQAAMLVGSITREGLGLNVSTGSGYGMVKLGRG
jgi:hypothetical protein